MRSALYRGHLMHARSGEFRRAFRYPVFMAAIDPSELPELDRRLRLFSYNRRGLYSLADRDYTTPLARATRLVTNLRAFGYLFNPVSFFLHYDGARIDSVVAEVNNTYGGRHCYELPPYRVERVFFVSPFLHGELTYDFTFDAPLDGDHLAIGMHVRDRAGKGVFAARFAGTRTPLSDRALAAATLRYPAMTAQVIGLIHWQALKLHLLGARYERPRPDHKPIS